MKQVMNEIFERTVSKIRKYHQLNKNGTLELFSDWKEQ